MNLKVYFRDKLMAEGQVQEGVVVWHGDHPDQVKGIANFYERKGYEGKELLEVMNKRLNGNWWTELEDYHG